MIQIQLFYDSLYEYRYYVDNSDYDPFGPGISDFMGNWPYLSIDSKKNVIISYNSTFYDKKIESYN